MLRGKLDKFQAAQLGRQSAWRARWVLLNTEQLEIYGDRDVHTISFPSLLLPHFFLSFSFLSLPPSSTRPSLLPSTFPVLSSFSIELPGDTLFLSPPRRCLFHHRHGLSPGRKMNILLLINR